MTATKQPLLFPELREDPSISKLVNVASVPQRSPFRYPGGKTWFVPTLRNWLTNFYPKPEILVEPFAGGGIISLTALFEDFVSSAVMVEIDEDIAAVWQTVVDGQSEWLAQRILHFDLTKESALREISKTNVDTKEKAFQTILRNRTLHGGILAEGAGFLKHGENGKGIRSRWYPATLAKRFNDLKFITGRITFRQEDGMEVIREYSQRRDAVFFIDPPYTAGGKKAGRRLYRYSNLDHERLFALCRLGLFPLQFLHWFCISIHQENHPYLSSKPFDKQKRLVSCHPTPSLNQDKMPLACQH